MGKKQDKKRKKENQSSSSDSSACNDSIAVSSVLSEVNDVLYGSPLADVNPVTPVIGSVQDSITSTPITLQHQQQQQSDSSSKSPSKDACPPWAKELVSAFGKLDLKVNGLYQKLEKLESVESKVMNISATFEKTIDEVKASLRKGFHETNKLISDLQDKSKGLEFGLGKMEESLKAMETENKRLKDDIVDLKSRSMRDNLLFSNIPERRNETPIETERVLRDFLKENLKMDATQVGSLKFDRVHRITGSRTPRVIVAKFNEFQQRQLVKGMAKNLRGTNFYINEQFPPEIVAERKELTKVMKKKREEGNEVRLVYNKLYVNNRLYRPSASGQ